MRETVRLFGLAMALGAILVYGSETLFWFFPGPTMGLAEYAGLIVVYGLAAATVISAVLLTSASGWRGFWLAGAMLGFLIEGVVVGEMYLAFPFQLVWTPLAWHMLLTVGVVVAVVRISVQWTLLRQCMTMVAMGVCYGIWASWWPMEKPVLPGIGVAAMYQFSGAAVAILGYLAMDRFGRLPRPPRWVLWIMPTVAVGLFAVQTVANPTPLRIFLPLMTGMTVWGMRRSQGGLVTVLSRAPSWRYLPIFLVPTFAVATAGVIIGQAGSFPGQLIVAVITCPFALSLWLWQIFRKPFSSAARPVPVQDR